MCGSAHRGNRRGSPSRRRRLAPGDALRRRVVFEISSAVLVASGRLMWQRNKYDDGGDKRSFQPPKYWSHRRRRRRRQRRIHWRTFVLATSARRPYSIARSLSLVNDASDAARRYGPDARLTCYLSSCHRRFGRRPNFYSISAGNSAVSAPRPVRRVRIPSPSTGAPKRTPCASRCPNAFKARTSSWEATSVAQTEAPTA